MWVRPAVHIPENSVTPTVTKKHDSLASCSPPNDGIVRAYDHVFWEDLDRHRTAETCHEVDKHLGSDQLSLAQAGAVAVVNDFVGRYEGMAIRVCVVAIPAVHQ